MIYKSKEGLSENSPTDEGEPWVRIKTETRQTLIVKTPRLHMRLNPHGSIVEYAAADLHTSDRGGEIIKDGIIFPKQVMEEAIALKPGQQVKLIGSYYEEFNPGNLEFGRPPLGHRFYVREIKSIGENAGFTPARIKP